MSILKATNQRFVYQWKTVSGIAVFLAVAFLVYGLNVKFRESVPNPLWMIWWAIAGSYGCALGDVLRGRYQSYKEERLAAALANPSGYTWTIYTSDNIKIGDIAEKDYFCAKHEADLCLATKLLQGLNILWVIWCVLIRMLMATPALLVIIFAAISQTTPPEQLASITLGSVLAAISENFQTIKFVSIVSVSLYVGVLIATNQALPGYKNFYGLRLKRLLAKHVPNIANAKGYRIDGWKISSKDSSSEGDTVTGKV